MKKKLLLLLLISMLSLDITGCVVMSKNIEPNTPPKPTKIEPIPTNIEKNIEPDKSTSPAESTLPDGIKNISDNLELYSDDSHIVFKNGQNTLVFGYQGNEITSYTAYIDTKDALTAKYALSTLLTQKDDSIKNAYNSGKYLVVEYNESEFQDTTLEEIKQTYSLLEESKKSSD